MLVAETETCFSALGEHIRLKVCVTSVAFLLKAHKKNHPSVISKLESGRLVFLPAEL